MTYEARLYHLLINSYSQEEFETLCLELGVKYDHLRGNDYLARARDFIVTMQRRDKLEAFVDHAAQGRPGMDWRQPRQRRAGSEPVVAAAGFGQGRAARHQPSPG